MPRPCAEHPFLDYESDGDAEQIPTAEEADHAAVARLLMEAQRRGGREDAASAMLREPAAGAALPESFPGKREAALRIRLDGNHLGASAQQLERAIAEILQLAPSN